MHDVQRGLDLAASGLAMVLGASSWSLSGEQVREAAVAAQRLRSVAQAAYLKTLSDAAGRDIPPAPARQARRWG